MIRKAAGNLRALQNGDELQYCVLHGGQSQGAPSEVDIAITSADVPRLEERLRDGASGQVVQLLEYESGCYCFVLAMRTGRDVRFVALDAAIDFRQDGCIFLVAQDLLGHRLRADGVWVAAPENEFAYLLVKKILKRALPDHQKARLLALSASLDGDARAIACQLLGARWGNALIQWLSQADWVPCEKHLARLKRALIWQTIRRDPLTPARYWFADLRRRWRRWVHPTGLCVAVSGRDATLRESFITRLREEVGGAFRRTAVLGPPATSAPERRGAASQVSWWPASGKWYSPVAAAIMHLWQIRPRLVRSGLVILDDQEDQAWTRVPSRGLMGFVRRLAGQPDLSFILGPPAGRPVAFEQEGEPNGVRRPGGVGPLAATIPAAWVVGASLQVEAAARNARDVVLDYLHRRYAHRRFLWFPYSDADTLGWLTAILCPSPDNARFVLSREGDRTPDSAHRTRTFGWITVKHGRGYLIPLDSRPAAVNALDLYNAKTLKARLAKRLLGMGLRVGIGPRFLRKVRLVAGDDGAADGGHGAGFLKHLRDVLGREDIVVAVSLGTPGPHRKPVLLALTREGKTLAYAKVGSTDVTNALVQREADILRHLAGGSFHTFAVPRVLHAGWWNGRYVCVQSPPAAGRATRASERLTPRYVDILKELATVRDRRVPLNESSFWKHLQRQVEEVSNPCYREPLQRGIHSVVQGLHGVALPFHLAHGDFAPWNMKVVEDRIVLFDWEHARQGASPAWDLFHFMFEILRAQRRTPEEMCAVFLHDRLFAASIKDYLASIGTGVPWQFFFSSYLLSRLAARAIDTPGHTPRFQELFALVQLLNTLEVFTG